MSDMTNANWRELGFTVGRDGKLYGGPAVEAPTISEDQLCGSCGCGDDQPCICNHGAECESCPDPDCPCCQQAEQEAQ